MNGSISIENIPFAPNCDITHKNANGVTYPINLAKFGSKNSSTFQSTIFCQSNLLTFSAMAPASVTDQLVAPIKPLIFT